MFKNKIFLLIPAIITLIIVSAYFLTRKSSQNISLNITTPEGNYEIYQPSKDELRNSFNNAKYEISKYEIPVDKIIDLIYPAFYPPNGFKYEKINIVITPYVNDEDRKRNRSLPNGQILVHIDSVYDNYIDRYTVSLHYGYTDEKGDRPLINLMQPGLHFSQNLTDQIDGELQQINEISSFKTKFKLEKPFDVNFYKSYAGSLNKDYVSISNVYSEFGVSEDKDYLVLKYLGGGSMIPEDPKDKLFVYIDPATYSVVKIKEIKGKSLY